MERLSDLTELKMRDLATLHAAAFVRSIAQVRLEGGGRPLDVFERAYPYSPFLGELRAHATLHAKGAIDPHDATTALFLLPTGMSGALIALAAPFAIVPRLGLRRVPFNLKVPSETTAPTCSWVDSGKPKPVSRASLAGTTLRRRIAAGLVVVSDELVRFSNPAADLALRDLLARALARFIDWEFCDPAGPFSVTAGSPMPTVPSTANAAQDLTELLSLYRAGGGSMESCAIILSSGNAAGAVLQGNAAFRDLNRQGGVLGGLPCVCSDSAGGVMIALDAGRTLYADNDEVAVDLARHTTLEMSDDPEHETGTVVSLFQANLVAIRVERFVSWEALPGSVAYVSDVDYLAAVGSPS